jgi:Family of unknown function (DUF6498)
VQDRLKLSALTLLLANLAPLAGVLFFGWSVSSIIILYWFENVVIGVVNVARMIALSPARATLASALGARADAAAASPALRRLGPGAMGQGTKLFLVPFFIFHYFFFCAGHGVFVFSLFPDANAYFPQVAGIDFLGTLARAFEIFATPLAFAAAALAASHVVSFFANYIGGGEYRQLDLRQLMTMPYRRIVILHLTIIFGAFATQALGQPIWLLVVFVIVKIVLDLKMHFGEHLGPKAGSKIEEVLAD